VSSGEAEIDPISKFVNPTNAKHASDIATLKDLSGHSRISVFDKEACNSESGFIRVNKQFGF